MPIPDIYKPTDKVNETRLHNADTLNVKFWNLAGQFFKDVYSHPYDEVAMKLGEMINQGREDTAQFALLEIGLRKGDDEVRRVNYEYGNVVDKVTDQMNQFFEYVGEKVAAGLETENFEKLVELRKLKDQFINDTDLSKTMLMHEGGLPRPHLRGKG